MKDTFEVIRYAVFCSMLVIAAWISPAADGAVTLLGVQYQQDELFPEYNCIWHDRNYPTSCSGTYLGGNAHVYLRNDGASPVTVNDVTLAGYSLKTVIKMNTSQHNFSSIYYYWDNPPQAILSAGEPVWYKADPSTIPPGGVAQAVIRLRSPPTTPTLAVGVVTSAGTVNATITVDANAPQLASVGFSQDLTKVYLHWRRSGGAAPVTIKLDGADVTASTTTVGDSTVNYASSVVNLATPLAKMSYHVFQGVYTDGRTATASLRAWPHPFIHASWGTFPCPDGDLVCGKGFVDDALNHGFNAVQNQTDGGGVADYLGSAAGQAYTASRGYGIIVWNKYTSNNPLLSFLDDEPDAEEDNASDNFCGTGLRLPCGASPMGILGMYLISVGEDYRQTFPNAPTTVNMNGTFKPENYYSYGQAVDVLQVDPYYQRRLADTYFYHNPEWIPLYNKATYIYAVSKAVTRAAEPNSSHIILYSCEWKSNEGWIWPFPTPESKRIEAYYALAAGAKGLSYWWFKPGYPSNGLGAQTAAARACWKEMGLYGNEIKTVSPLLVTSHPVDMALQPSAKVWARALACGTDTIFLIVVNDDYYNDINGCHYNPVANATVTASLPTWMRTAPTAFEVSAGGIRDVGTQLNGSQLQVNLGTLNLTRMIVVTTNVQLRGTIEQRYAEEVRPGVCAIAPELCVAAGPTITQQPTAQSVCPGATAVFSVAATGSGTLTYRWQKNYANLSDGGHYSGATTPTLTVTGANQDDVAGYRCVVTDSTGSTNSNQAALTLAPITSIAQHPSNRAAMAGQTVTFTVGAVGAGPLGYQWQKNGANLADGGHYSGSTTATLTIAPVGAEDVAGYRCTVTGGCGSATSNTASLSISAPGDFDADGDVDLDDFAALQKCLTGPFVGVSDPACLIADLDADGDVDFADVSRFVNCVSGPGMPANPNCMQP